MGTFLKKSVIVLVYVLSFVVFALSNVGLASSNVLNCTKEEATTKLKRFFEEQFRGFSPSPEIKIHHVLKVKEVDFPFCAVVYELLPCDPKARGNNTPPTIKQIVYYGSNFFIAGDVTVLERDGSFLRITQKLYEEHNQPYFEWLRKKAEEEQRKSRFRGQLDVDKFREIKKSADLSFPVKDGVGEVVVFVDPFCSFCKRFEEVLKKLHSEKLLSYYLILTPVLGKQSNDVIVSVLCDKKTTEERAKGLADKYVSKRGLCKLGLEKAQKNLDLFMNIGSRGVPLSLVKVGDEIRIFEGAISETEMRKIFQKSSN